MDLKQVGDRVVVIEINDNPNIDAGVEDAVLGEALYRRLKEEFVRRIETVSGWRGPGMNGFKPLSPAAGRRSP